MSLWTEPSPSDYDRWEALVAAGEEPSTAAKAVGHTCSAFRRTNPARHAEILELGREARAGVADERGEQWALAENASDQMRLAWLKRWSPAWALHRVEVGGPDGGPIPLETRSTSLAEVFRVLADAGALTELGVGAAGGTLPAAHPVLAEPPER